MYQNISEGKFIFFERKLSKHLEVYYLEPGFYPHIKDFVKAMNTFIHKWIYHREKRITVTVSRRTQKIENYYANNGSGLALFRTNLGHIFGSNVGNGLGVLLRVKGSHKPVLFLTSSAYIFSLDTQT